MEKLLIVYPHGLGDHVLLTPALRKIKQLNPDIYIALASQKRFGTAVEELLEFTFVDEFLPILSDPWENVEDYSEYLKNINQLDKYVNYNYLGKFNKIVTLPILRQDGFKMHKIFRIADELGVQFDRVEELATELTIREDYGKKALDFLSQYDSPIMILHNKAGNSPKHVPNEVMERMINDLFKDFTILEFGRKSTSRSIEIPEDDMRFTKALVGYADFVCAIDSIVMHIAGAFRKDLMAMFTITPVHQAIPLFGNVQIVGNDNELTEIRNWEKYKQDIITYFNTTKTRQTGHGIGQVLVTGTGHSGGNWVTEIINLSGKYKFTEFVEDRTLFNRNALPDSYGTKLAIENFGVNIRNLRRLLTENRDLKIVYTMRHPVDNCLSMIYRASPSDENEQFSGNWLDYHPTGTIIGAVKDIEYSQMILDFLEREFPDRFIIVKLEDLIENTEREVNRICEFLDLEKNEKMLEAYKYSRNVHHKKRYNNKLDRSQVNIRDNIDSVYGGFFENKKGLVDQISNVLRNITTDFGYENIRLNKLKSKLIRLPDFYYQNHNYWAHMITSKCNAECEYCLVNGRGPHIRQSELSGKEILEWWNNIEHPNGFPLSFMARETTLHPDIVEIINNIDGYYVTLTTNVSGPFYENKDFEKKFKPLPSTKLRINTSYHPHILEPEKYVERIKRFRDAGFHVGQTMFVYTPEVVEKWGDRIRKVQEKLELESPPYLGFWDDENKYKAKPCPENLMPNEKYHDQEMALKQCGIDNYDLYRKWCGADEPKTVYCPHVLLCLLVSPSGLIYNCHYRMYYNKQSYTSIKNFIPPTTRNLKCEWNGHCNACDYPRLRYGQRKIKLEGIGWLDPGRV